MARGLDEIVKRVIQFRDERDWRQFHDPKNLAEAYLPRPGPAAASDQAGKCLKCGTLAFNLSGALS